MPFSKNRYKFVLSPVEWSWKKTSTPSFSEMHRKASLTNEKQEIIAGPSLGIWTITDTLRIVCRTRTAITSIFRDVQGYKKKRLNAKRPFKITPRIWKAVLKEASLTGASLQIIKKNLKINLQMSTTWAVLSKNGTLCYQRSPVCSDLTSVCK